MTHATIMGSSLEGSAISSRLTSLQNSKGNMGRKGAEWERGRKNRQFLANKSPYIRNGDRLIGSRIRVFDWYQYHPPRMNLNDLQRPKRTLVQKRCVFWRPLHKIGGWAGGPSPPLCGQLTRFFFVVAELLVHFGPTLSQPTNHPLRFSFFIYNLL